MKILGVSFFFLVSGLLAGAEDWANWRGPAFDGSSQEQGIPARFGPTEALRWKADLPGVAASTPVVSGDCVFVTSTDEKAGTLLGLCLDRKTGALRWQREVGKGFRQDDRSTFAGPSPATDGERVIFFFGTGDLAAFDFQGNVLWSRQIQKEYGSFAFMWTFSTSPLLFQGKLYLQVLQRDTSYDNGRGKPDGGNESYLLALNPATGQELWRTMRPSDANAESREAFSTPMPYATQGRMELLIAGGDVLTGHDPETGKENWRTPSWNPERIGHRRMVVSPVAGAGVVLGCAPKRAPVYAWKTGGTGLLNEDSRRWVSGDDQQSRDVSSDVATPLFYRDRFYIMNSDRKAMTCVEPDTGKVFWEYRVENGSKIECSPTAADGRIYFQDHRGTVTVLAAGDEAKLLHQVEFGGVGEKDIRSSIAIAHRCLFIRTNSALYCIGE